MLVKALQKPYLIICVCIMYFSHDQFFVGMDQRDQKPSLFSYGKQNLEKG